jgi:hypothetical protein
MFKGSEKLVLEGGKRTLKKVDFVLMETSFTPMYIGEPLFIEMIEAMKAIDFEFVRPIGFLKSPQERRDPAGGYPIQEYTQIIGYRMTERLLLLSPFFFPEPISTGRYNTFLVQALVDKGVHVDVICFHPLYPNWRPAAATKA